MNESEIADRLLVLEAENQAQSIIIEMLFKALHHHRLVSAEELVGRLDSISEAPMSPLVDPAYSTEYRAQIDAWAEVFNQEIHAEISPLRSSK